MQIDRYSNFEDIPMSADAWNELVGRSNVSSVFLRYEWIHSWWKHYGSQYQLIFITAKVDSEIVGFAPLMIDAKRRLRFIGDMNSDYLDFVATGNEKKVINKLLLAVHDFRDEWRLGDLRNIPQRSPLHAILSKSTRASRIRSFVSSSTTASSLVIKDRGKEVRKILSRYSLRRAENRLSRLGTLQFVTISTLEAAVELWPQFEDQHIRRCAAANRRSNFEGVHYGDFLLSVVKSDTHNSIVHFSALLLDSKPVAFHFGLISENCLLWYKPSFEIALSKYSPGTVLIKKLIEEAMARRFDRFDFTIGPELFKERFACQVDNVDSFRLRYSRVSYSIDIALARIRFLLKSAINFVLSIGALARGNS